MAEPFWFAMCREGGEESGTNERGLEHESSIRWTADEMYPGFEAGLNAQPDLKYVVTAGNGVQRDGGAEVNVSWRAFAATGMLEAWAAWRDRVGCRTHAACSGGGQARVSGTRVMVWIRSRAAHTRLYERLTWWKTRGPSCRGFGRGYAICCRRKYRGFGWRLAALVDLMDELVCM